MSTTTLTAAQRGIDCNATISAKIAAALAAHGYTFAVRYVPRVSAKSNDLTVAEVAVIRAAGLGLMVVQHVESESSWMPTLAKGTLYGVTAARQCATLGIAQGTHVWCDLEGVAVGVPSDNVVAYCNEWYDSVAAAGYLPGLYVGWHCGLDATALYGRLRFAAFWSAYNLNRDQWPAVRGPMLHQRTANPEDIPPSVGCPLQVDLVSGDALGSFPVMDCGGSV